MTRLNVNPRLQYSNDDVGRAACLADYQRYIDEMVRGLVPDFVSPPRFNIRVQRVPQFKEATAPGPTPIRARWMAPGPACSM